jgi:small subunit ribosomal protein S27Ae
MIMAAPAKAPAKGAKAKVKVIAKGDAYKVEGDKVTRTKPSCPKCGPGVFMAAHKDRVSCGKCGYTEFSKKE